MIAKKFERKVYWQLVRFLGSYRELKKIVSVIITKLHVCIYLRKREIRLLTRCLLLVVFSEWKQGFQTAYFVNIGVVVVMVIGQVKSFSCGG